MATKVLVVDLDAEGGGGEALDLLSRCKNKGFEPRYSCDHFWEPYSFNVKPSLLLFCLVDESVQGMALIARNQQLALPFKLWTLTLISSKLSGCGSALIHEWIRLAKKNRVEYLSVQGYSDKGKRLYEKFDFVEYPSGTLLLALRGRNPEFAYSAFNIGWQLFHFDCVQEQQGYKQAMGDFHAYQQDAKGLLKGYRKPSWLKEGVKLPQISLARWLQFRKWSQLH